MGVLTTHASDGVQVEAADRGHGPVILIVHPGLDDGSTWRRVFDSLARQFRVLLLRRRRYRLDVDSTTVHISDEAADVLALVEAVSEPMVIVGHSSGAVVALEAILAAPQAFSAAVLYEPPVVTDPSRDDDAIVRARGALASRKPGRAIEIFARDIVKLPRWQGPLVRAFVGVNPRLRRLAPRQIDDAAAISALGNRLAAYEAITTPVMLVGGQRSPANLTQRLDALEHALPNSQRTTLGGQGHAAQQRKPQMLADLIAGFASRLAPTAEGRT
jgi:pimeloyl-ACP methyl ester carboxylesterase